MKTLKDLRFPNFIISRSKLGGKSSYDGYSKRIRKTLYYGHLPSTDRPSLPVTEILVDKFGKLCKSDGFNQLNLHDASSICYDACVTPCSVIVALLYLDRLRTQNPEYLASSSPSQVFVVSLMVASKYLYDDGEEDEVFNDEWAASAAMLLSDLNEAEKNFLAAIDWNLFVDVKSFMDGLLYVESNVAIEQGILRGFFVYSDLVTLTKRLPPLWSSFLSLVGSALVVCFVGYTVIVSTVATGIIATKECGFFVANQVLLGISPTPLPSFHPVSNCSSESRVSSKLPPESGGSSVFIVNSCDKPDLLADFEKENCEDVNEAGSFSFPLKLNALQTLTTALLLACPSSLINTPNKALSQFSTLDPQPFNSCPSCSSTLDPQPFNSCPCSYLSLFSTLDPQPFNSCPSCSYLCENNSVLDTPFIFHDPLFYRDRLLKSCTVTEPRRKRWRKSKYSFCESNSTDTVNETHEFNSAAIVATGRNRTDDFKLSSRQPEENSDFIFGKDYFYYTGVLIDSLENLIYYVPMLKLPNTRQEHSINLSLPGTTTDTSALWPPGDQNYYHSYHIGNVEPTNSRVLLPPFLAINSPPKSGNYVQMNWKSGHILSE